MAAARGTKAWFETAFRRCSDHIRALISIRAAHRCVTILYEQWSTIDHEVAGALHHTAVVSYSRPFTPNRSASGGITYSTRALKHAHGFDAELHKHILDLRNRLVAHHDYDVLSTTMFLQAIGDEKLPVRLGINSKLLLGLASHDLCERYRKHIKATGEAVETTLTTDFKDLADAALENPEGFASGANLPNAADNLNSTSAWTQLPRPTGVSANVTEPEFPSSLSDYRYTQLVHEQPLLKTGTYKVHQDGQPTTLDLDVDS